jgi:hypothetical protein
VHGSFQRQDHNPKSRPDLIDIGLLALPIVLSVLAFAFGTGIIQI